MWVFFHFQLFLVHMDIASMCDSLCCLAWIHLWFCLGCWHHQTILYSDLLLYGSDREEYNSETYQNAKLYQHFTVVYTWEIQFVGYLLGFVLDFGLNSVLNFLFNCGRLGFYALDKRFSDTWKIIRFYSYCPFLFLMETLCMWVGVNDLLYICKFVKCTYVKEGILWHFSPPNPFLLNKICLN